MDLEKTFCPVCHMTLNSHTRLSDQGPEQPEPGNLSICFYCDTLLIMTEEGLVVAPQDIWENEYVQEKMAEYLQAKKEQKI